MSGLKHWPKIKKKLKTFFGAQAAAFSPRNIKASFHSVTKGFREYICFFIALFIIQAGFTVSALSLSSDLRHAEKMIKSEFDYHLIVTGLDDDYAANLGNTFWLAVSLEDEYLSSYRFEKATDGSYSCCITLFDGVDSDDAYAHIRHKIRSAIPSDGWTLSETPLFEYQTVYRARYIATFFGICLLWLVLSCLTLTGLYRIRFNHFRFRYGIYMTCGGGFTRLYGAACGEMLALSCLTLLPAAGAGVGLTALICAVRGSELTVTFPACLTVLLTSLLVVTVSVWRPMRKMSLQPPIVQLSSADNASYVTSPRKSFKLYGEPFPGRYELYSMWRFRKYYLQLLISATLFAAVFVTGLYGAEMQRTSAEIDPYEYVVCYGDKTVIDNRPTEIDAERAEMLYSDGDYFISELNEIPGIAYTYWAQKVGAGYSFSHLLLTTEQMGKSGAQYAVTSSERATEGYTYAINSFDYLALDGNWLDTVLSLDGVYAEGDPYAALDGSGNKVVLTEDVYNKTAYSFKPGDKVTLAVLANSGEIPPTSNVTDPRALLREQIQNGRFHYTEFTVCAVLHGLDSEYNISFGINKDAYNVFSGYHASRDVMYLYLNDGADATTVKQAMSSVQSVIRLFSGWRVISTGNYFESKINATRSGDVLTVILSALIVAVSPLIWAFSQILFYRNRSVEFELLSALGAAPRKIRSLFFTSAGILSVLAFAVTCILACIGNWLINQAVTSWLPALKLTSGFYYEFRVSLPIMLAAAGASLICGFASGLIPYAILRHNRNKMIRAGNFAPVLSAETCIGTNDV